MRAINIMAAFAVLACNLIVSFNHSLELFRAGGFTGGLEYVAVIGAETTFIMGALNLVVSRLRGYSPGAPAVLGGLLGVLLVGWSNVSAGWEYGITGILLGLATPVSLIISEAILSRAILQGSKKVVAPSSPVVEVAEKKPEADPLNDQKEEESIQQEEIPSTGEVEKVEDTSNEVESLSTAEVEEVEEGSNRSPIEWALFLHRQDGELPGRRKLMEAAGCSEWAARQALAELRKRIS